MTTNPDVQLTPWSLQTYINRALSRGAPPSYILGYIHGCLSAFGTILDDYPVGTNIHDYTDGVTDAHAALRHLLTPEYTWHPYHQN